MNWWHEFKSNDRLIVEILMKIISKLSVFEHQMSMFGQVAKFSSYDTDHRILTFSNLRVVSIVEEDNLVRDKTNREILQDNWN